MPFGNKDVCNQKELGKCVTIDQRMKLVSCPRLDTIAKENYLLSDGVSNEGIIIANRKKEASDEEEILELKASIIAARADITK